MGANKKITELSTLESVSQKLMENIPTKVSKLSNDTGYQTAEQVAAIVSAAFDDTISAAYDAVAEMGGTVPEGGGGANLPAAIRSIPSSSADDYCSMSFFRSNTSLGNGLTVWYTDAETGRFMEMEISSMTSSGASGEELDFRPERDLCLARRRTQAG